MFRFSQPIGKQYSFGKGPDELTEVEQLKRGEPAVSDSPGDIQKVQGNRKELVPEVVLELVEDLNRKYTISTICYCIGVPRATYYRWKKRGARKPSELEHQIKEICERPKFRVCYRTVTLGLNEIIT